MTENINYPEGVGGGGGILFKVLYWEAPPTRGTLFKLQVCERVGKSVIWVCEMAQRAEQMNFMTLLIRGNVLFSD